MDITKCKGTDCIIKEKCIRYTAKETPEYQSWFVDIPFKIKDNEFTCDMYWGENSQNIFNVLGKIIK